VLILQVRPLRNPRRNRCGVAQRMISSWSERHAGGTDRRGGAPSVAASFDSNALASWPALASPFDAACRKIDEWERGSVCAQAEWRSRADLIFPIFLIFSPVKSGREI
jgi:hypothetical protein